jgi:hypothetical protein
VVLNADVIRVAIKFEYFAALTSFIFPNENKSSRLNSLNHIGVDFVSMTVSLINRITFTIQLANFAIIDLPQGWAAAQSHCTTEVSFGDFRHEDNCRVLAVLIEFSGIRIFKSENIPTKFDGCNLQSKANAKIRC